MQYSAFEEMFMSNTSKLEENQFTNNKNIKNITSETITKHTIDNITYTTISYSSKDAKDTLKNKLEASIAREIGKIT